MTENKIELGGIFSEGYGIIPKKLMQMTIGNIGVKVGKKIVKVKGYYIKLILSYMLSFTGAGKLECFPSIRKIAEDLEISKDIVVNSIKAAEKLNLIDKQQMYPNDPLKHNNKYILRFMSNPNYDVRQQRITCADGTNYQYALIEQNNNIINNNKYNKERRFKEKPLEENKIDIKQHLDRYIEDEEELIKKEIQQDKVTQSSKPPIENEEKNIYNDNKKEEEEERKKEKNSAKKEKKKEEVKEVIDYLNKKCGKKFSYKNKTNLIARLEEGYTVDDCKQVIDNKLRDKYFIDNPQYLNPTTLYRPTHFENYLNETIIKKQSTQQYHYDDNMVYDSVDMEDKS